MRGQNGVFLKAGFDKIYAFPRNFLNQCQLFLAEVLNNFYKVARYFIKSDKSKSTTQLLLRITKISVMKEYVDQLWALISFIRQYLIKQFYN